MNKKFILIFSFLLFIIFLAAYTAEDYSQVGIIDFKLIMNLCLLYIICLIAAMVLNLICLVIKNFFSFIKEWLYEKEIFKFYSV